MPAGVHEYFIDKVEDEIRNQLKQIRSGSDNAAIFAQKINCSRSTTIHFPLSSESRHDPDTSFKHDNARYPGVIVEVGYSQKRKSLGRLAENYLLDSNANIQVVVCLDIEYGKDKGALRKATLSVWRTHQVPVADGQELRVFQEIADEVCPILRLLFHPSFFHLINAIHRHSGMSKEIQPIIWVYDFN